MSLGYYNTCVRIGADVKCWGYGSNGRNGYSSTSHLGDNEVPASYGFVNVGIGVQELSNGGMGQHQCVRNDADIRCWGNNDNGQLGYGDNYNIGDDELPSLAGSVSYL
jgi:hypothetical protein